MRDGRPETPGRARLPGRSDIIKTTRYAVERKMPSIPEAAGQGYTGCDVLEVMAGAVNYNRWLGDLVTDRAPGGTQLLDFGAGTGTFSSALRDRGFEVQCVEVDDRLRKALQDSGFRSVKLPADLAAGSAPFIFALNVLEHIEDDQGAVNELARVLPPGGTLLIYVPAFQVLYSALDRKVGHFRRYRLDQVVKLARNAGLTVAEARYADCLGFLASLAYKWIGVSDGSLNGGALKFYDRVVFPISRVLDLVAGSLFGKNVLLVARKPV
jgi:SAM-dependent methyltransferase